MNELPERLELVENATQTVAARVDKLQEQSLKRALTRGSIKPVAEAKDFEIHDKPTAQEGM